MTRLDGAGVRVVVAGTGSHRAGSTLPEVPQVGPTVDALAGCMVDVCGVRPDNVVTLIDPSDPEEFLRAVSDAARDATDVLLLYYVGHGVVSATTKLHLATHAAVDLRRMPAYQALPYEHIVEEVRNSRAGTIAVVLDCCYSARAENPVASGALLASADVDERAIAAPDEELTAFSGELVRALRAGIPTAPASLSLQTVHDHLVRALTAQDRPQPQLTVGNRAGQLILAPNRAYRAEPAEAGEVAGSLQGVCPYRGLDPFTATDADVFHGRGALIERILPQLGQRARTGGITVVTGPSGSGKSSLLAAGILPAIARGDLAIHGSADWPALLLTPGDDPLTALAERLSGRIADRTTATIRRQLAERADDARVLFREAAGSSERVVVVVDQFEEQFAADVSGTDQQAFVRALSAAAVGDDPAALVVLGLRSDFHGPCARFPELLTALQEHQVVVGPMTTAELRAVIVEPAAHAGLTLQHGIVDHLLAGIGADPGDEHDTAYDPGALPLLSHALLATWQHRQGSRLTVDGYWQAGGVTEALAKTAEDTYASLTAAEQRVAEALLPRMVNVGEGTPQDTRRGLRREPSEDPAATAVLEAFAANRLVTLDGETANLTHEALIRAWDRLRDWIDRDRADRRAVQRLEDDATTWAESGDDGLLYRGTRLGTVAPGRPDLTRTARDFLTAAHRQQRRATRARHTVAAIVCVLALVASAAAVTAFLQARVVQQQRDDAVLNQVIAQAERMRATDVSLAAQLDLVAYRMRPGDRNRQTAVVAAGAVPLSTVLPGDFAEFSPDGETLAVREPSGTVQFWDIGDPNGTPSGAPFDVHEEFTPSSAVSSDGSLHVTASGSAAEIRIVPESDDSQRIHWTPALHRDTVNAVAISPDKRILATGSADRTVRLWSITVPSDPVPLGEPLVGHLNSVSAVVFSPDGHRLATVGGDGTVRLWHLPGGVRTDHAAAVHGVAFSPTAPILATTGADGTVRLWDTTDPARLTPYGQALEGHGQPVRVAAFSQDGAFLATGGEDGTTLWKIDEQRGHASYVASPSRNNVFWIAFSADDRWLAIVGEGGSVKLWSVDDQGTTPGPEFEAHDENIFGVVFHSVEDVLITAGLYGFLKFWNTADYSDPISAKKREGAVLGLAFTLHQETLVTVGAAQNVEFWNAADPREPVPLGVFVTGHTGAVNKAAFGPEGSTLATIGFDRTVRLWDTTDPADAEPLDPPLTGHTRSVNGVAFSPDGKKTLATTSDDGSVRLWQLDPEVAAKRICATSDGNLTEEAWARYVSPDLPYDPPCAG